MKDLLSNHFIILISCAKRKKKHQTSVKTDLFLHVLLQTPIINVDSTGRLILNDCEVAAMIAVVPREKLGIMPIPIFVITAHDKD